MEFLALIVFPFGIYLVYKVFFTDLRTGFQKDFDFHIYGIRQYEVGYYENSLRYFEGAKTKFPKSALVHLYLAKSHCALGNTNQALYYLQYAVRFDNTVGEAYQLLGRILEETGEYGQALLEYDKAVWHLKQSAECHFRRGCLKLRLGKLKSAKDDFKIAGSLGHEEANFMYLQKNPYSGVI